MLQASGVPSAPKTPVILLPYHEIALGLAPIEERSLDEKVFGL